MFDFNSVTTIVGLVLLGLILLCALLGAISVYASCDSVDATLMQLIQIRTYLQHQRTLPSVGPKLKALPSPDEEKDQKDLSRFPLCLADYMPAVPGIAVSFVVWVSPKAFFRGYHYGRYLVDSSFGASRSEVEGYVRCMWSLDATMRTLIIDAWPVGIPLPKVSSQDLAASYSVDRASVQRWFDTQSQNAEPLADEIDDEVDISEIPASDDPARTTEIPSNDLPKPVTPPKPYRMLVNVPIGDTIETSSDAVFRVGPGLWLSGNLYYPEVEKPSITVKKVGVRKVEIVKRPDGWAPKRLETLPDGVVFTVANGSII